jgi:hypothetical protein
VDARTKRAESCGFEEAVNDERFQPPANLRHPLGAGTGNWLGVRQGFRERIEAIAGQSRFGKDRQPGAFAAGLVQHFDHAGEVPLAVGERDVDLSSGDFNCFGHREFTLSTSSGDGFSH